MRKDKYEKYKILTDFVNVNKFKIIISCFIAIIVSFISIYIPILVSGAIDNIVDINKVNFDMVIKYIIFIGILTLTSAIVEFIMNLINNKLACDMSKKFRGELSKKINSLNLSFIENSSKGDITSIIINDTEAAVEGLYIAISKGMLGLFTIFFTIIFMIKININLAIIVIILTPLSIIASKKIVSSVKLYFKEEAEIMGKQTSYLNEIIYNQKNVMIYTNEEKVIEKFEIINERLENISIKAKFFSSLTNPCSRFINNIIYVIVTILGSIYVLNKVFSVGILTAFLSYASKYNKPFNDISEVISEISTSFARINRIEEILKQDNDKDKGKKELVVSDNNDNKDFIKFKNVTFGYIKNIPVIKDVSFEIGNKQKIAIVGQTGCGKTTLINLLMRFYEINSGKILVNDTDILDYSKISYRENFGMVLQNPYIKNDTVMNNLRMGNESSSDDEIYEATKKTNCYEFINKLPDGFDTIVNNSSSILSEGEKQLIAITRVMILNPKILILDEATSNIDTRTEKIVQNAFDKLMENKTSIVIAHRLATIKSADKIIVMDDGKVVEMGNHMQLLAKRGYYYQLQNNQR